ncbi:MAG: 30S ribosomal protein S21 [Patescibacteria group bacterium]|nr:30S ribosomal protein S21 [Patescibacteria group bacterium]
MVVVKAQPGETSDAVIRKFTRKVLMEGILQDLKRKEFYVKPAEIRKEKKRELARKFRQSHKS